MLHLYCISGLGADSRIFEKLQIENAELHFIHWVMPQHGDDMRSYALRLALQIKHAQIVLIGVSFGGMLASEIQRAKQQDANALPFTLLKTILISSCKHPSEFPLTLKLAGQMRIHKIAPYRFVLRNRFINRIVFDLKSNDEELYLKKMMLKENSVDLVKRSIHIILSWRSSPCGNLVHIHGTSDRLLTPARVNADYWIKQGGHFMVWNRAKEVSDCINKTLTGLEGY